MFLSVHCLFSTYVEDVSILTTCFFTQAKRCVQRGLGVKRISWKHNFRVFQTCSEKTGLEDYRFVSFMGSAYNAQFVMVLQIVIPTIRDNFASQSSQEYQPSRIIPGRMAINRRKCSWKMLPNVPQARQRKRHLCEEADRQLALTKNNDLSSWPEAVEKIPWVICRDCQMSSWCSTAYNYSIRHSISFDNIHSFILKTDLRYPTPTVSVQNV